jgi:uncharacterized protein (DUF305 family)
MMFENGPFHSAEKKMHHEMKEAKGDGIDETWVRKMIVHHQGGIEMSQIVLENGSDPMVREMAEKTIREQTRDIGELEQLLTGMPAR